MAYTPKEQEAFDAGHAKGHTAGHATGFEAGKVDGHKAGVEEGKKLSGSDAVKADRERRSGILALDEAKERPQAARALADTDMSVDSAKIALANMPKEVKAPEANGNTNNPKGNNGAAANFADAMNNGEHPEAHAGEADAQGGTKPMSRAEKAMAMNNGSKDGRNSKRFGARK